MRDSPWSWGDEEPLCGILGGFSELFEFLEKG
jgi:hypothetical protein